MYRFFIPFFYANDRRIAKSKIRLKHRNSLIFTKRKNMGYNFVVNLSSFCHKNRLCNPPADLDRRITKSFYLKSERIECVAWVPLEFFGFCVEDGSVSGGSLNTDRAALVSVAKTAASPGRFVQWRSSSHQRSLTKCRQFSICQ